MSSPPSISLVDHPPKPRQPCIPSDRLDSPPSINRSEDVPPLRTIRTSNVCAAIGEPSNVWHARRVSQSKSLQHDYSDIAPPNHHNAVLSAYIDFWTQVTLENVYDLIKPENVACPENVVNQIMLRGFKQTRNVRSLQGQNLDDCICGVRLQHSDNSNQRKSLYTPPRMLVHPEEFKNPSSFLKLYGDPLCASTQRMRLMHGNPLKDQDGNWTCKNASCGNVNYPRRFKCFKCQTSRDIEGDKIVSAYARQVYQSLKDHPWYKKLSSPHANPAFQQNPNNKKFLPHQRAPTQARRGGFGGRKPQQRKKNKNADNNNIQQHLPVAPHDCHSLKLLSYTDIPQTPPPHTPSTENQQVFTRPRFVDSSTSSTLLPFEQHEIGENIRVVADETYADKQIRSDWMANPRVPSDK